ncbi:MAG: NAD(+) diphosphatase [Eubacterium sp.]|nr:NAD(+) diphosphatase [Eubacterium sp.]
MIQDIYPSRLKNEYKDYAIRDEDNLLAFDKDGKILIRDEQGKIEFLKGSDVKDKKAIYLFGIDDERYFLLDSFKDDIRNECEENEGIAYYTIREIRDTFSGTSMVEVYAAFTAYHLWRWYAENRFCGRCGTPLKHSDKERALICPDCGSVIYPRINPAVIVAVTKGDKLLLTRYRSGYAHNALVAGFTEIGETLEETVAREVMEETGVGVKNIRYYKSQPWGMAQDILVGFFCDADGDGEIHMDEDELKYAEWVKREDIVLQPNNLSLTNEMMKVFKEGKC